VRLGDPVEPGSSRCAVLAALLCACGSTAPPAEDAAEADDGSDGIAVDESSSAVDGADDPTMAGKLDVASNVDSGGGDEGGPAEGCQRVDVVLAVDNSSSMGEEIEALQGPVLDALPQALLSVNGGIEDFQLAVIDACPKPAYFHDQGATGACDFSTGHNYMSSTSPDLVAEFACVTDFAPDGFGAAPDECLDSGDFKDDDEQAAWTSAQAIGPPALMGANAGFVRDDALLFVVAITDEDESLVDVDSADAIYDAIVAAKGGDVSRVVFLGVAGASDCDGAYGSAEQADTMAAVVERFAMDGRGAFWDICQGELEQAFLAAIADFVDPACEEFTPVG
jgi:hypothetical protein